MSFWDHFLFLTIAFLQPVAGYIGFRRLLVRIQRGLPLDRMRLYRNTMLTQWVIAGAIAWLWIASGRGVDALGLGAVFGVGFGIGAMLTLFGIAALIGQTLAVLKADQATIDEMSGSFGRVGYIVPRTPAEFRRFIALSITAGIVEELMWRGFLLWYLTQYVPTAAAALFVTVGFGIAHCYQGWRNVPKITLVAAAFTGLYLLTGSILLSIVLHAAVDMLQGHLAYEISRRSSYGLADSR